MTSDVEQEEVERVKVWIGRLREFTSSLDGIDGEKPVDFCENACDAWQTIVMADSAPPTSPAMALIVQAFAALTQVMTTVTMDWADTPDVRDRLTRSATQQLVKDALDAIVRDGEPWLAEGLPSADEIKERIAGAGKGMQANQDVVGKRNAEFEQDDEEAAADPYGAVLGYQDPAVDSDIIFTKVCSFTEEGHKRYMGAYDRIRRMLDSELLRHISDQSDRFCDLLMGIILDLKANRIGVFDEDAWDERRRKVRSALISFTSALQSHEDQTIRAVRNAFGRRTPEEQAVLALFNDLKTTSFECRWLGEMRDALLHGDINAFKYDFTARMNGEPAVNVYMDRGYMLEFTREARNKPWLNRNELEQMTSDPSVPGMIQTLQPLMGPLQDKLDAILYPSVASDAATVKELIGRFNGRRGLYALQTGPGFTRRLGLPPIHRLAPRVLAFADNYQADA
jgi:hypothetical protein